MTASVKELSQIAKKENTVNQSLKKTSIETQTDELPIMMDNA